MMIGLYKVFYSSAAYISVLNHYVYYMFLLITGQDSQLRFLTREQQGAIISSPR